MATATAPVATAVATATAVTPPVLLDRQQAILDAIDHNTSGQITDAFAKAVTNVMPDALTFKAAYDKQLADVKQRLDASGDTITKPTVSLGWLFTSGYLDKLVQQMHNETRQAAQLSADATDDAIADSAQAANATGKIMVKRLLPEVPQPLAELDLAQYVNTSADDLADTAGTDVAQKARTSVLSGVLSGLPGQALLQGAQMALQEATSAFLGVSGDAVRGAANWVMSNLLQMNNVTGWIWVCTFDDSCISCILMHVSVHENTETLDSHKNCGCYMDPYYGPPPDDITTGLDWLIAQDDAVVADILGPAAYGAWLDGDLDLADLVARDADGMIHTASLKSLGLDFREYLPIRGSIRPIGVPDWGAAPLLPGEGLTLTAKEEQLLQDAERAYMARAELPELPSMPEPGNTRGYNISDEDGRGQAALSKMFKHDVTPDEIGGYIGAQRGDYITLTDWSDAHYLGAIPDRIEVRFNLHSADWNPKDSESIASVEAERSLTKIRSTTTMRNDYMEVADLRRGQSLSTQYFAREVNALADAGVKRITVDAANGLVGPNFTQAFGYYSEARHGFDATLRTIVKDMEPAVRAELRATFPDAKYLQDIMRADGGPQWWRAHGVAFEGTFD